MPSYNQLKEHDRVMNELGLDYHGNIKHSYNIGDIVTKKSGKPFKSGKKEEIVTNFAINEIDPKKRNCVVFEDGSQCNIDMLNPNFKK